jgi:cysteine desulfuration protein SufE
MSFSQTIADNFAMLVDWEERYAYLIELGKAMPESDATLRQDDNKVQGCASQVWIRATPFINPAGDRCLHFEADSDAMIVRGLIAILMSLVNDQSVQAIQASDPLAFFKELSLDSHLSGQRANGLAAMIARIQSDARHA